MKTEQSTLMGMPTLDCCTWWSSAIDDGTIHVTGNIAVTENQAGYGGGFFSVRLGQITLHGAGWFHENKAIQDGYGGAVHA